ncbi:hypothetical protein ACP70R_039168 [Stipagrostis hirtigluma subsp. patula]
MLLNLSSNKRLNVDELDKAMAVLEKPAHLGDTQEDVANKEARQSSQLLDMIGDILQLRIVRNGGSNAEIWGLYARWHKN